MTLGENIKILEMTGELINSEMTGEEKAVVKIEEALIMRKIMN